MLRAVSALGHSEEGTGQPQGPITPEMTSGERASATSSADGTAWCDAPVLAPSPDVSTAEAAVNSSSAEVPSASAEWVQWAINAFSNKFQEVCHYFRGCLYQGKTQSGGLTCAFPLTFTRAGRG